MIIIVIHYIIIPIIKSVKNKILFILGVTAFFVITTNAQTCSCDYYHTKIYSLYNAKILQLRVCGDLIDFYKQDKVITEFFITDCRQDTVVNNQIHNEGEAFLLKPLNNGFSVILIDIPLDETDPVPAKFQSLTYYIESNKLKMRNEEIPSKPIIQYLKKFQKYQKIK